MIDDGMGSSRATATGSQVEVATYKTDFVDVHAWSSYAPCSRACHRGVGDGANFLPKYSFRLLDISNQAFAS